MALKSNRSLYSCMVMLLLASMLLIWEVKADETKFLWMDHGDGTATITNYLGIETELAIPAEVDGLSVKAISGGLMGKRLTAVTIPDSVQRLLMFAFSQNELTTVTLPPNVREIGDHAFSRNHLTEVVIWNESVSFLGANVFADNDEQLTLVGYAGSTTQDYASEQGYRFQEIISYLGLGFEYVDNGDGTATITGWNTAEYGVIPDTVRIPEQVAGLTVIGIRDEALQGEGLMKVTIPSNVEWIGDGAFRNNLLTEVVVHNADTIFGEDVFAGHDPLPTLIAYAGSTTEAYAASHGYPFDDISTRGFQYIDHGDGSAMVTGWDEAGFGDVPDPLVIPAEVDGLTVQTVGSEAFPAKNLTSVTIANTVTEIGDAAFADNQLTTVVLPDMLQEIGTRAFADNEIASIDIPDDVTAIGEQAFMNNKLVSIVIPEGVKDIAASVFEQNLLAEVMLPDSLEVIGARALRHNQLTKVDIPTGVTEIGDQAFANNELTEVTLPNGLSVIGNYAFEHNKLTNAELPADLTEIRSGVFYGNELTSVELPDGLTEIGYQAFFGNRLEEVSIPSSVTTIGDAAFRRNQLTQVIVHHKSVSLGSGDDVFAFNDPELTLIGYLDSTTEEYADTHAYQFENIVYFLGLGFEYDTNGDGTITVTGWNEEDYGATPNPLVIPSENSGLAVTGIGERAFQGKSLTGVTIPDSVTTIGNYAFTSNRLTSVVIPDNVTSIGDWAFYGNNLTEVMLGGKVRTIGERAFEDNRLVFVHIPDSVIELDRYAFYDNQLSDIEFGDGLVAIQESVFSSNKLRAVVIPEGVITIGPYAFEYNNLSEVVIPDSVETIGAAAFMYNQLEDLVIPDSVTKIGDRAFQDNQITHVQLSNSLEIIGVSVFQNNQLTEVKIPDSVRQIWNRAFQKNNLSEVVIPDTVTDIFDGAFNDNDLSEAVIHDAATTFGGETVFSNNASDLVLIGYSGSTTELFANEQGYAFAAFDSVPEVEIHYDGAQVIEPVEIEMGTSATLTASYNHDYFDIVSVQWIVDGKPAGSGDTLVLDRSIPGEQIVELTVTTSYGGATTQSVRVTLFHNIQAVDALADIRTISGTELSSIGLPSETAVTMINGDTMELGITWDNGDPEYDGTVGTYVFTGILTLKETVRNPLGLTATVEVHVMKTAPIISFGTNGNETWSDSASTTVQVNPTDYPVDSASLQYAWTQDTTQPEDGWKPFVDGDLLSIDGVDGDWYLHIEASDVAGNTIHAVTHRFLLDTSGPHIQVEMRHDDGSLYTSGQWTNQQVDAVVEATDVYSGLDQIYYSTDDGVTWLPYVAPVPYSTEGTHSLRVRATDIVGNFSETDSLSIHIDRSGLIADISLKFIDDGTEYLHGTWTQRSVIADVYADQTTESVSVTSVTYSLDGVAWRLYESPLTFDIEGEYALDVHVIDSASNEARLMRQILIDRTEPTIHIAVNGNDREAQLASTLVEVMDSQSGVDTSQLRYVWTQDISPPSGGWQTFTNGDTLTLDDVDGDWYLHIEASDVAGNIAYAVTNRYRLNSSPEEEEPGDGGDSGSDSSGSYGFILPPNSWMVGVSGKIITFAGGQLQIPDGAWPRSFYLTIEEIKQTDQLPVSEQGELISGAFDIRKDQAGSFQQDVTITLDVDVDEFNSDDWTIGLYWLDKETNEWVALDNLNVDWEQGTVSGTIDHLATSATTFSAIAQRLTEYEPSTDTVKFIDVHGHWAAEEIYLLAARGVLNGYPDGSFQPDRTMTRAEFVSMLVHGLGLEGRSGHDFVDTVNFWGREQISIAVAHGIVEGYDSQTFGVNDPMTREQMAVMMMRALQLQVESGETSSFRDQQYIADWARDAVTTLGAEGILQGLPDGTFQPQREVTRAEAAVVLARVLMWQDAREQTE